MAGRLKLLRDNLSLPDQTESIIIVQGPKVLNGYERIFLNLYKIGFTSTDEGIVYQTLLGVVCYFILCTPKYKLYI